jgi:hypothetical protein
VFINLPDDSRLEFRYGRGSGFLEDQALRWSVAVVIDEEEEMLLALRWRAENLTRWDAAYNRQFAEVGEAALVQKAALPVDPVLFSCYAIQFFDQCSHVSWASRSDFL